MITLHRELGGTAMLVRPDLLIMVEPQPKNPGAVITTYSGEKIAVKETFQQVEGLLAEHAKQRR